MNRFESFLSGIPVGDTLVWLFGPHLRTDVDARTRRIRARAADTQGAAAESPDVAREPIASGLAGHSADRS